MEVSPDTDAPRPPARPDPPGQHPPGPTQLRPPPPAWGPPGPGQPGLCPPPRPLLPLALAALAGAFAGARLANPLPLVIALGLCALGLFRLAATGRTTTGRTTTGRTATGRAATGEADHGTGAPAASRSPLHHLLALLRQPALPHCLGLAALVLLAAPRRAPQQSPATEPLSGLWETLGTRSRPGRKELITRGSLTPPGGRPRPVDLSGQPPRNGEAVALLPPLAASRPARSHLGGQDPGLHQPTRGHLPLRVPAAQLRRLGPGSAPRSSDQGAAPRTSGRPSAPDASGQGPAPGRNPGPGAWRRALLRRVERLADPVARGLAAALCLGDRSHLPRGLADLFTRTGTRHLLAVSGLHVGLMVLLLALPARLLRRGSRGRWGLSSHRGLSAPAGNGGPARHLASFLRASLILALIPLTGGAPPVRRAALVLALAGLAPILPGSSGLRRRPDALSLWSLALLWEVLANPLAFDSLSLKLSYSATLGLILGAGPLDRLLARRLPFLGPIAPIGPLADVRRSCWRVPLGLLLRGLRGSLAASLAAVGATLPLTWPTFGEWSPVGPAATCLALVPVALMLASGWLFIAAGEANPLAEALGAAFTALSRFLVTSLELWDRLPGTPTPLPPRPVPLLWLAVTAVFILLRWPGGRSAAGRRHLARAAALAWGLLLLPWAAGPRGLEVYALDVGHGTAVLVRAPGEPACLVDAGSRDRPGVAREALAPLLRSWEVRELTVILTHGDLDHAGALPWLVARFPARLWAGAPPPPGMTSGFPDERLDLVRGRCGLPARRPGPQAPALVLLRGLDQTGNEGSRSLEVAWEGRRLLLTGDAEGAGLAAQLRAGWLTGPLDLLLLPHHGSETPHFGPLLTATDPTLVWISESGTPHLGTELDRRRLPWRATGPDGPLALFLGPRAPLPDGG